MLPQRIDKLLTDNQVVSGGLFLVVVGFFAAYLHFGAQLLWDPFEGCSLCLWKYARRMRDSNGS